MVPAEVVGLMCFENIFGRKEIRQCMIDWEPACKLECGFFKKVIFSDYQSDFEERGRVYFHPVDFELSTISQKLIEEEYSKKTSMIR